MIDCLILGDQIANGLTDHVSGCAILYNDGATSTEFYDTHMDSHLIYGNDWDTVIICLGINDRPDGARTRRALRELRNGIRAKNVYWLLPPENVFDLRNAVHDVAIGRQDMIIDVVGWNKNTLSPRGYKEAMSKLC